MLDGDRFTGVDPVLIDMQARTQVLTAALMAVPPKTCPRGSKPCARWS
jgi:hypothetical protein